MNNLFIEQFKIHFLFEFKETIKSKWYLGYLLALFFTMFLYFSFGLSESKMLGFTGLGRILLSYIQICMILLPIFILITVARTFSSDRELGVWEYNLSLPTELSSFYWGKSIGRFITLVLPIVLSFLFIGIVGFFSNENSSWSVIFLYCLLLISMIICFLGIALCLSVLVKTQELALGGAFILWITFEGLIDILLLGMMVKERVYPSVILAVAFFNPLQSFRVAAISLFDPELTVLGPISYSILEIIGFKLLVSWAILWPAILGIIFSIIGFIIFKKRDLL